VTPGENPRPVPAPDELSAAYWAAAAQGVLTVARCSACGWRTVPPTPVCPHCHSCEPAYAFEPVSGHGVVRSWTVIRQAMLPGFDTEVPYLLVDVELAEQAELRLIGRLLDGPDTPLRPGVAVRAAFEHPTPELAVPAFTLADGA
jgi:uncharacterized OB-fold protein